MQIAYNNNSELELLAVLKSNSFLFYQLYDRKYGIQPAFHEVTFGGGLKCDFAWLNDRSGGPEWVLVEIEKPRLKLLNGKAEPSHQLNHAIEQVKSWRRYFNQNPNEKRRIFGAVARFRFVLVAGSGTDWSQEAAAKWRIDNDNESLIDIRTSDVFERAIEMLEQHPDEFWSFAQHPTTRKPSALEEYWKSYRYMDSWRKMMS